MDEKRCSDPDCDIMAPCPLCSQAIIFKVYEDHKLQTIERLMNRVLTEHELQIAKWGIQKRTLFEWHDYLSEEVGELAEAIAENHYRNGPNMNIRNEAIQVAVLGLKIAEMIQEATYELYELKKVEK